MLEGGQPDKPAILVLSGGVDAVEREVLAGIEEEGVPYVVEMPTGEDAHTHAHELALRAAGRSSLSVGVGIDDCGRVCVQHQKLADRLPGLFSPDAADRGLARALGHNAARIVVGIPLRTEEAS
ncbi:MAG: glycerol dehydratase reactivase beta/small subunit family protein [Mycobacterium sp.]